MTGPMNDNIFSGEAVSIPPFVEEDQNDDASADTVKIVSPDSEEGAAALEDDFDETMSDKIDILINKIDDLITVGKIDKLIDSLNEAFDDSMPEEDSADFGGGADVMPPDMEDVMNEAMPVGEDSDEGAGDSEESSDDNTEKEAAMATIKKRAADDQIKDTQTADEVLDQVVDQGTMFDQAQDESHDESTVPDSANVGDNYAGNTDTVSDTDDLKPVTTSAAMRLADAYIKAGVLKEADRYNAIDRIASTMTRTAARNQLKALDLVRKASRRKSATVRKAEDGSFTITTDPGFSATMTQTDDGVDGVVNGEEQHFDTMEEAMQYVSDNSGLDMNADEPTDVEAARKAAARRAAARKSTKKVAEQWVQLKIDDDYEYKDDTHGRIVKCWAPTDETIIGDVYQLEDGTYGFYDNYNDEVNGFKTLDEAKNALLKAWGRKPVSSHASRMSSAGMKAARRAAIRKAAARRAAARRAAARKAARRAAARKAAIRKAAARRAAAKRAEKKPAHRMTAAQRKELAARIAKAKRAAKISSNDNKSMREAALAAARKKAARNPRLASASTAASADASLSLI